MESIYTELALYGRINECARTDNVFSPISEICDCTVSLTLIWLPTWLHFGVLQNSLKQGKQCISILAREHGSRIIQKCRFINVF